MGKYIIIDQKKGYTFQLKAGNGETILVSELYNSLDACKNGIKSVTQNAPVAKIDDLTGKDPGKVTNPKFEIYADKAGKTRFRLKAKNGEIIGASEPYNSKQNCKNGIASVVRNSGSEIK